MTTFAKLTYFFLILIPLTALAGVIPKEFNTQLQCLGMYSDGGEAHVFYDPDSSTINFDGSIYKIETATEEKNGYATVNFTDKKGYNVYISLIENKDKNFKLLEYDVKTNKLVDSMNLACHKPEASK